MSSGTLTGAILGVLLCLLAGLVTGGLLDARTSRARRRANVE